MRETEENHVLVEFNQDDLPGFATVDVSLRDFTHKDQYNWHLSVLVLYNDLIDNKLPSTAEQELLYEFEDSLNSEFSIHKNTLFFARVTWNEQRELMWRVIDPELPNDVLRSIIEFKSHPRPFDFRIDDDPTWEKAAWYFQTASPQTHN